jgi:exosortase C (VPDSG-CTERM-specific)
LNSPHLRYFGIAVLGLIIAFILPLYRLAVFSVGSELYSHILLIPVVSVYLAWQYRNNLPAPAAPDRLLAAIAALAGLLGLAAMWSPGASWSGGPPEDSLALTTATFLAFVFGSAAWFLGRPMVRALVFPLAFLLFMIPLPVPVVNEVEFFLQHGSAAAARLMFSAIGSTYFYYDLHFQLPGINLLVAPECSGIHSSLALLIVSLVAGRFFLKSSGARAVLALAVIPLGLLRNGVRIVTIGELCVRIGPHMIDSYIHHHGGPIFFALSLIPFSLIMYLVVRWDRRSRRTQS